MTVTAALVRKWSLGTYADMMGGGQSCHLSPQPTYGDGGVEAGTYGVLLIRFTKPEG